MKEKNKPDRQTDRQTENSVFIRKQSVAHFLYFLGTQNSKSVCVSVFSRSNRERKKKKTKENNFEEERTSNQTDIVATPFNPRHFFFNFIFFNSFILFYFCFAK